MLALKVSQERSIAGSFISGCWCTYSHGSLSHFTKEQSDENDESISLCGSTSPQKSANRVVALAPYRLNFRVSETASGGL